jgi:hypothetical protein
MVEPVIGTCPLTAFSADFRWTGEVLFPLHLRMSDFINDRTLVAVVLNQVTVAEWENDLLRGAQNVDSIALFKHNLSIVVPGPEPSSPSQPSLQRVQKYPLPVTIHMPSYTIMGQISLLPGADWLRVVTSANEDFLPITKASMTRTRTRAQVESALKFMLVNRPMIQGIRVTK